jgi:DNA-binding response OmpR family regulator
VATLHRLKPNPAPKRRILVVEDDLDSVHSMALLIKMMGHECSSRSTAWPRSTSRARLSDIIILDIGLRTSRATTSRASSG